MFYDGVKTSDLGSRAHILKHLHGGMIFGPFEKVFHEGTLWSGYRAVIYFILTKTIFLHFFRHGDQFYNRYLNSVDKNIYIDDDGYRVKPNHALQRRMKNFLVVIHYRQCLIEIGECQKTILVEKEKQLDLFISLGQYFVKLKITCQ